MKVRVCKIFTFLVLVGFAERELAAQPAYASNSSNNRIYRVNFENGTTTQVNPDRDAQQKKSLQGMVADASTLGEVNLIVCDAGGSPGAVYFYSAVFPRVELGQRVAGVKVAEVAAPDGPSLGLDGELFLVSSPGGSHPKQILRFARDPACETQSCAQPFLGAPEILDTHFEPLLDTKVVRHEVSSALEVGDLLVLTQTRVLRYRPAPAGGFEPPVTFITLPAGDDPAGMDFGPGGRLYVSMVTGIVRRFSKEGARLTDLTTPIGNGKFKVSVGVQDGRNTTVVANRNGAEVLRFRLDIDPNTDEEIGIPLTRADADIVTSGVEFPVGTALASQSTPASQGDDVFVEPCAFLAASFDEVDVSGLIGCTVIKFADPRASTENLFLCEPGSIDACQAGPGDVALDFDLPGIIPPHVRPLGGEFFLAIVETTARFNDTVLLEGLHPGLVVDCNDMPQAFSAPRVGEPPVVEGQVFANDTTGCENPDLSRKGFSLILTPAIDTRGEDERGLEQLANLRTALTSSSDGSGSHCERFGVPGGLCGFVHPVVYDTLVRSLDRAITAFRARNYRQAGLHLDDFVGAIEANASQFDNSQRNVRGELKARALAALFTSCTANATNDPSACTTRLP